jgi:hypothetical protein
LSRIPTDINLIHNFRLSRLTTERTVNYLAFLVQTSTFFPV